MRRQTCRKGTSKRAYKRIYKRTYKRVSRKQSGGKIDMELLNRVLKQRSRASDLAAISAKKAKEFKELIEML
jgi:hypothetical protein